ncbi:hypothetical protein RIF29_39703 [Crotalaria pallida]|uniref:Uncharacterized protein n=1 Tax=Crotalaria pallida TaxID=3830 RepID=A0AAN9HMQ9_CROPI
MVAILEEEEHEGECGGGLGKPKDGGGWAFGGNCVDNCWEVMMVLLLAIVGDNLPGGDKGNKERGRTKETGKECMVVEGQRQCSRHFSRIVLPLSMPEQSTRKILRPSPP